MNKTVKKVLMCEPKFYEVNYVINPWMKVGSVNKKRAYKQWEDLLNIYQKLGIKVEVIEQKKEFPDMVFTADQGFVKGDEVLLSNFYFSQRKKESLIFQQWFEKSLKIKKLSKNSVFEGGGEMVFLGKKLFIGTGFRANKKTAKAVKKIWPEIEIISLELINPFFFHLDTCLFVLNKETVFYYPSAFSEISRKRLKENTKNLIPILKNEAFNFASNSVSTDHMVVGQKNNHEFGKEIEKLGYRFIETDVSEFMKAGGGIHCLTGVLEENTR